MVFPLRNTWDNWPFFDPNTPDMHFFGQKTGPKKKVLLAVNEYGIKNKNNKNSNKNNKNINFDEFKSIIEIQWNNSESIFI